MKRKAEEATDTNNGTGVGDSDSATNMTVDEINEVIADLEKEKEDRMIENIYNKQREEKASKLQSEIKSSPLMVHFKRPPKTSEEAIETLKEADQRFEANKQFLVGKDGGKLIGKEQIETHEVKQERIKQQILENVPEGVTVSRLVYPIKVDGVQKLSDIILLGVRQRTVIHASYVNGKLTKEDDD